VVISVVHFISPRITHYETTPILTLFTFEER
jgi:hypothetical protein